MKTSQVFLVYFCFSLQLIIIVSSDSVTYEPIGNSVDLYEGESLFLEIKGFTNKETNYYCTYKADKYNCDFEVKYTKNQSTHNKENSCYSKIETFGEKGLCRIKLSNIDIHDPKHWELSIVNQSYSHAVNVNFFYKARVQNPVINLLDNGSFVQTIISSQSTRLSRCTLSNNDTVINLDVNRRKVATEDSRITSIGNGVCGFKLNNANIGDSHNKWILIATDEQQINYKGEFEIVIFPFKPEYKKHEVFIGELLTIQCGDSSSYCELHHPTGEIVYGDSVDCSYKIQTVRVKDIGKWKCLQSHTYSMTLLESVVELVSKDELYVKGFQEETDDYLTIGCQVISSPINNAKYCLLTKPDGKTLRIDSSLATERYTALATDLKNNKCGIEIKQPLFKEEIGKWVCQIRGFGTYIDVGNDSAEKSYEKHKIVSAQINESLVIFCKVPFSSDYCHITDPKGDVHRNENEYSSMIGECKTTIKNVAMEHNGTWTCSYARNTGVPDEQIIVEVKVAQQLLTYNSMQVVDGESVNLICQTAYPIQYCRFISPAGLSYHLKKQNSSSVIGYYGKGLQYGDCGVSIKKVQLQKHSGQWTCMVRIGRSLSASDISARIQLQVNPVPFFQNTTSLATSVGLTLGLLIVAGLTVTFYIRRRRRRSMNQHMVISNRRNSNSSSGSDDRNPVILPSSGNIINYTNENRDAVYHIRQRNSIDSNT